LEPLKWHSVIMQFRYNPDGPPEGKDKEGLFDAAQAHSDVDPVPKQARSKKSKTDKDASTAHGGSEFWPQEKCIDRCEPRQFLV